MCVSVFECVCLSVCESVSVCVKAHTHTPFLAQNWPILTYNRPIIVVELADYSAVSY